uniref:Uncharacterized protein n=1 Tax=Panagrolaimus davidi TaxID=227884 RepID=A0A914PA22_9BILA
MDIFEDPIFVIMNNDGNIIRVQVNKTYTFKKLRTRILNDCGIPLKLQCFTCADERNYADMDKEEGEEADNDRTLETEGASNMVTTSESNDVTDVNSRVDVQINNSGCHDMINGAAQEGTSCTFFVTYITLKCIDGKATAIFVKEMETIEAVMYRIQERSGLSLDHQEFTCFDKRTLEEKFWEEEYKRFVAAIQCEDDMVEAEVQNDQTANGSDDDTIKQLPEENAELLDPTRTCNLTTAVVNGEIDYERLNGKVLLVKTLYYFHGNWFVTNSQYSHRDQIAISFGHSGFRISSQFHISLENCQNLSSVLDRIICSNLKHLELSKIIIPFCDYKKLTGNKISILRLTNVVVNDENGVKIGIDKLWKEVKNVQHLEHTFNDGEAMSEIAQKLVELVPFENLEILNLENVQNGFDLQTFYQFLIKNTKVACSLSCSRKLLKQMQDIQKEMEKLYTKRFLRIVEQQ